MTRFSVVVATKGRPTLGQALRSLAPAGFNDEDELIVAADGPELLASVGVACARFAPTDRWTLLNLDDGPHGDWGSHARNQAVATASGTHILWLDDDDAYCEGGIDTVREAVPADDTQTCHIFRMMGQRHGLLWKSKHITFGNVGGPMLVAPTWALRLAEWPSGPYTADYDVIRCACSLVKNRPVWHEDLIYWVRPGDWVTAALKQPGGTIMKSNGQECVLCAKTGSILFKKDAVKVNGQWYRPEEAPKETSPAPKAASKTTPSSKKGGTTGGDSGESKKRSK